MTAHNDIIYSLQQHQLELEQKFGIEKLALFGSFAKNEQSDVSDVDLLIVKMKKKNALTIIKAKNFISDLLGRDVDIGLLDSLRPFIRNRVEKEMIYV